MGMGRRVGQADGEDDAGRYTSVLSGLGMVVRHAIHPLAAGSEGQLVRIKTPEFSDSIADIAPFSGYLCSSGTLCT